MNADPFAPVVSNDPERSWDLRLYQIETWEPTSKGGGVRAFLKGYSDLSAARAHYADAVRLLPPDEIITLRKRALVLKRSRENDGSPVRGSR